MHRARGSESINVSRKLALGESGLSDVMFLIPEISPLTYFAQL